MLADEMAKSGVPLSLPNGPRLSLGRLHDGNSYHMIMTSILGPAAVMTLSLTVTVNVTRELLNVNVNVTFSFHKHFPSFFTLSQVMRTFGWSPTEEELKEMVNVIDQVDLLSLFGSQIHRLDF